MFNYKKSTRLHDLVVTWTPYDAGFKVMFQNGITGWLEVKAIPLHPLSFTRISFILSPSPCVAYLDILELPFNSIACSTNQTIPSSCKVTSPVK